MASRAERNVELTRRGFDAYDNGDYEALARLFHPEVELHADSELINAGDFRGHEDFLRWNAEWIEAWEEFTNDLRAVEPIGERYVLAEVHQTARGAGSGVGVEMDVCWAFEVSQDLLTRMHIYPTREQAVAAIERWGTAGE